MYYLGCVWINRSAVEHMSLQNAYEFCYNLDTNARVIEVYREEQMDFLSVIIGKGGGDNKTLKKQPSHKNLLK